MATIVSEILMLLDYLILSKVGVFFLLTPHFLSHFQFMFADHRVSHKFGFLNLDKLFQFVLFNQKIFFILVLNQFRFEYIGLLGLFSTFSNGFVIVKA